MKNKFSIAMTLAVIMSMLFNSLALADNVVNNIDTTVDTAAETRTITVGNSTVVGFYIDSTTGGGDANGCNATGADKAYGSLSVPSNVTASQTTNLEFVGCGSANAVNVTFSSSTPGTYIIQITSVTGGKPGSIWNLTTSDFRLVVSPPADSTPPVITKVVTGTLGNNGWYTSNVSVDWTVSDPESSFTTSGCVDTTFSTDTASATSTCSATSAGGTSSDSVTIKRDATAPSISGAASPAPNVAGWNNTDVSVAFSCSDGTSGVASCGPNQTLTSNGADQSAAGNAVDNAGNSASATVANIDIDKELPSITASVPTPNANNWYNGSVIATFECDDLYSGVASCEGPHTFSAEGSSSFTGHATDIADNANSTDVTVMIDTNDPVIALVSRTPANANGWNNGDVELEWSCTDEGGSGAVAATISKVVSAEGEGQSESATCEDLAGNTASDIQTGINIDLTAPTASATALPAPNGAGWNNTDVTVTFSGTDGLSGLDTCSAPVVLSSEGAGQSASGTCTDEAGNVSTLATVSGINIDKTAPTASGSASPTANGNGWNNTDVTVTFSGTDGLSGLDTCSAPVVLSSEGAGQSASGTCTDEAGNVSTLATVGGINIDKTAPSITITTPANGASFLLNQAVAASYSCADATSGIATCAGPVASGSNINTAGTGSQPFTVNASDQAGNTNVATNTYTASFKICALYDQTKSHRAGSTVPIKLQLCDFNGLNYSSAAITVRAISVTKLDNSASGILDDSGAANSPDMNFRYDATLGGSGGYIFNLSTKGLTTGTWKVTFTINGASDSTYFVKFDVK